LSISLPETLADNILLRRAQRLRRAKKSTAFRSQSEIDQEQLTAKKVAFNALVKPWQINILDPAVLFTTIYTAILYGIFYSFFESFPVVYSAGYGFDLGETGLAFIGVMVGLLVALPLYCAYFHWHAEPVMLSQPGYGPPESRLMPAIIASFFVPIGLFLFGKRPESRLTRITMLIQSQHGRLVLRSTTS
jgi:MFS transporter, DHA1 family, multidrug resistance protein